MFAVNEAKKKILKKLVQKDWTPTELAEELNQTTQTTYNHLKQLEEKGLLEKKKIKAKTRPKTQYSIGKGFVQYIAALPGDLTIKSLKLNDNKKAFFKIWSIPQPEFHKYLEELWYKIKKEDEIIAFGVYGSVARGEADQDSDIDILLITTNKKEELEEKYGSKIIETEKRSKLIMTKTYTLKEYQNSLAHESDFLSTLREEIVPIYDPEEII
ncbi:MAG: Minimal nucleotidyltransferase [Candidatus Methanohalarchaeum thermophilum]|uniref:Minimal nucleotidyltransferase n=1 Tax=Methanohalarchaeum thermophilum TaxID=1903181 RepID=A0A1Q6DSX2_METT1|nr:MAG: Minimal nucleotidyltransferase [Candidatus Methanohalarchaeum thermophilum]